MVRQEKQAAPSKGRYGLRATDQRRKGAYQKCRSKDKTTPPRQTGKTRESRPSSLPTPTNERKRKREETTINPDQRLHRDRKRQRTSEERSGNTHIHYWCQEGVWPRKYFEPDTTMSHLLARTKSSVSLRRKRSDSDLTTQSSTTPSDQKPREDKSAPYRDQRYTTLLVTKGSFMGKSSLGIKDNSKKMCQGLLDAEGSVPDDTLFHDDFFEQTCEALQDRNEARVLRDISLLLVPSAENLAIRGHRELRCLVESVNEGWNNSIPITKPRPQPDYSVGFRREAFTDERLQKLQPFVGELTDQSFFMGTYYLYFPFLTCEVKCGAAALDVADRQNAHSMTMAVRGVVELFRLVHREKEVDREILAFSISHDHESVRIYGHYALIDGKKTTYHRHPIRKFDFTEMDGKEKWTTYKFTKSVYRSWMPAHFARLCSVIDTIPADLDFGLSQSELHFSESTGLSQEVGSHHITDSNAATMTTHQDDDSPLGPSRTDDTPGTSFTQDSGQSKKARRGRAPK
ncbi:hypothetical protein LTR70_010050 [Exophiala xenobiotica]|uniref:DUF7924 domain-containing protein n=1 Tax=Lithohypha guttulata TaxID=1690604 RepID=A0ABR0JX05_9EURO|nr:hypothetical protein LTR24_009973 [Lithohypha guttulata]KAK5309711.1 hypothetical protein LTR70_010050 [Exophiala xenobiotica]